MLTYTISDLHLEFQPKMRLLNSYLQPADTLVLAGDIGFPNQDSFSSFLFEMKKK